MVSFDLGYQRSVMFDNDLLKEKNSSRGEYEDYKENKSARVSGKKFQ